MSEGSVRVNREELMAELQRTFDPQVAEVLLGVLEHVVAQAQTSIPREDFSELKQIVAALADAQQHTAEAQQRTEKRVGSLEAAMERLAEAQQRTEERVGSLEAAMERLAEAQQRTEERVGSLEAAMERLAEAQQRTEERVGRLEAAMERLAEAQQRTEAQVGELAKAQQRTERRLEQLSRQVGGLSDSIGGDIEDVAYIVLHDVLKREFGWEVGVLERSWQTWGKHPEEVNVFGQATHPARPGRAIWIVGEAKHNLTLREVQKFTGQVKRAQQHLIGEVFPVCFCYRARPEVQQAVRDANLRLVFSYGKLV